MKKMCILVALGLILSGCGAAETYETVADEMIQPAAAEPCEVWLSLPEDSVMPAMESEFGTIYICGDYDVAVLTLPAGDLDETLRTVSGFGMEDLTVVQTGSGELDRYEFVWTAAGELGQQIGRATIIDDGSYHYCLSATVNADLISEYQEVWNGIFESFKLV